MSPVPGWHGPTGIPGAAHISSPISQGAGRLACPCPVCLRPSGTLRASLCPVGSSGHDPLCGYRCCEGNGERGVRCGFRRKREMKNQGHHFLPAFPQQRATVHRTGRRGRYLVTRYRQPGPDWLHCRKPQRPWAGGEQCVPARQSSSLSVTGGGQVLGRPGWLSLPAPAWPSVCGHLGEPVNL